LQFFRHDGDAYVYGVWRGRLKSFRFHTSTLVSVLPENNRAPSVVKVSAVTAP
jgi:hypothetical protein